MQRQQQAGITAGLWSRLADPKGWWAYVVVALGILMTLLGTIDTPGGFRHKAPFPRPIPPCPKPPKGPEGVKPNTPLDGMPLGWPADPDDLFVDDKGEPVRIDKAFSWEHPLSVHGLMHNVITNAWRGDPYKIDTLLLFMANMAWNSSMNVPGTLDALTATDENGDYVIPRIIYSDAYSSEMVAYADLILPDTTYLERHDCISLLDRPISEPDAAADAIRWPVVEPDRDVTTARSASVRGKVPFSAGALPSS